MVTSGRITYTVARRRDDFTAICARHDVVLLYGQSIASRRGTGRRILFCDALEVERFTGLRYVPIRLLALNEVDDYRGIQALEMISEGNRGRCGPHSKR